MSIIFENIIEKLNSEEQEYIFNIKNKIEKTTNYRKEFYLNNKEKIKEYSRQYYLKNRDKKKQEMLDRYYKNKKSK